MNNYNYEEITSIVSMTCALYRAMNINYHYYVVLGIYYIYIHTHTYLFYEYNYYVSYCSLVTHMTVT